MKAKTEVAFLQDGSFFPLRNGTVYSIYGVMNALRGIESVSPNLVLRYRGWDDSKLFANQKFRTIFVPAGDTFKEALGQALVFHNIKYIHLYNAEEVIELADHLQNLGINAVYEAVNIDHILYLRLGADKATTEKMRKQQTAALQLADYVLCRSEVDKQHILDMGIKPNKVKRYRGAIDTSAIAFKPRKSSGKKIVFLGHMYYPPNENSLKLLAEVVLPKLKELDCRYTITVIGIAPPAMVKKYSRLDIKFVGGVDSKAGVNQLSKELQKYDLAVCPVLEGSGTRLKLLDFMASGLPTVTTDLGVEGLVEGIKGGLIIENNINAYAEVVHNLSSPADDRDKMVHRARKYVEDNYNWRNNIAPFKEIYSEPWTRNSKDG